MARCCSDLPLQVLDGTKKILPSDSDISSIIYSKVSSSPSGLDNFIKRKTLFVRLDLLLYISTTLYLTTSLSLAVVRN